jgi:hypothetical protein
MEPLTDTALITNNLKNRAMHDEIRITLHGHQEMAEENILYMEVRQAIISGQVIENYPEHQRGSCCLLCGKTEKDRYLHVVCTTSLEVVIIITVYEPKPPKWTTPFQRRS